MHGTRKHEHTNPGDKMKNNKEIMSSLLKTTQVAQIQIRSVLDNCMRPGLRKALENQLHEYDALETEAHCMTSRRGWDIPHPSPGAGFVTDVITRMKLGGKNTDSQIAGMIIQSNTKELIRGIRNRNRISGNDEPLQILSQKLLDCETASIRQMQNFL